MKTINEQIKTYITKHSNKTTKEIANHFGVSIRKVSAIKTWLKRGSKEPQIVNTYSNSKGEHKQNARIKIVNAIRESMDTEGKILSLPFETCQLELLINKRLPSVNYEYLGCEREEDTYFNMLKTIAKERLNMNAYKGSISDKIYDAKENEYAHLILDYCGVLNTFAEEIKYTIENNIVRKGGTISITLSKLGFQNKVGIIGEILSAIPDDLFINEKETSLGTKLFFSQLLGKEYTFETFLEYKDKGKMPMMLIILRRK